MRKYNRVSEVEKRAEKRFGKPLICPDYEKIHVLELPGFPELGKLVSLRFLEWLQLNPEGVISLPTGKTPEHFIFWTLHFLKNWSKKDVAGDLESWGLNIKERPVMKSFYFVQIDEFYPIDPKKSNSFQNYIRKFYIKGFGLDPAKTLLMDTWTLGCRKGKDLSEIFHGDMVDLSLRYRKPTDKDEIRKQDAIYRIDDYAMVYETKIRELGGIGFFLGGIGPDGHIAFNIRGSDHHSTTRVININYETAAASASDLGGIELAKRRAVITIGLETITQNPSATAIVMAAGQSKAGIIKDAVENNPDVLYPATALQKISGARFYLTAGAASGLTARKINKLENFNVIPKSEAERILVDISASINKKLTALSIEDLRQDTFGRLLVPSLTKSSLEFLTKRIERELSRRVKQGIKEVRNKTFLHTAPHHDDIMLGYLPYILHLVRQKTTQHYFATLTSGFTSITNKYALYMLENTEHYISRGSLKKFFREKDYFNHTNIVCRNRDVYRYLDGIASNSEFIRGEAEARRGVRNIVELTGDHNEGVVLKTIRQLKNHIAGCYPGQKDMTEIQRVKGMIREWEEELLWAHLGFSSKNIYHLRLGFYTGDIFTPQPEQERDVRPFVSLLEKTKPDVVTVAFDPEGTGPDTHYKVLQIISAGLQEYLAGKKKDIKIWGYRNVWHRFHPSEANIYVPVSMNSLAIMRSAFDICFVSQREASFPSYEYDGPFSELAQQIMVDQCRYLKRVLGNDFFGGSEFARIRASRGINFLREMSPEEFFAETRNLKKLTE